MSYFSDGSALQHHRDGSVTMWVPTKTHSSMDSDATSTAASEAADNSLTIDSFSSITDAPSVVTFNMPSTAEDSAEIPAAIEYPVASLMGLPAELRLKIWELLLTNPDRFYCSCERDQCDNCFGDEHNRATLVDRLFHGRRDKRGTGLHPQILRTCRQVSKEATEILYKNAQLDLDCLSEYPSKLFKTNITVTCAAARSQVTKAYIKERSSFFWSPCTDASLKQSFKRIAAHYPKLQDFEIHVEQGRGHGERWANISRLILQSFSNIRQVGVVMVVYDFAEAPNRGMRAILEPVVDERLTEIRDAVGPVLRASGTKFTCKWIYRRELETMFQPNRMSFYEVRELG